MGHVNVDIAANERKLHVMFPMNTRQGVETFLENINHVKELQYFSGDYDALIMLIDFEQALNETLLTEIELKVIELVFYKDLKRVQVADMFGVQKQTVQSWIIRATEKLARYYEDTGDYEDDEYRLEPTI